MMADLDPSEHSVDELSDELDEIDDPETLQEIREAEANGEDRTGAKAEIDERLKAVSDNQQEEEPDGDSEESSAGTNSDEASAGIVDVRDQVRDTASDLIGRPLDGIVEIERNGGEWRALVEIVERRSVPDTQDILGRYALELDGDGETTGYRRLDRYRRGDTRREEASETPRR
jgi:hypothetical protein